jgi:hypothetical protein
VIKTEMKFKKMDLEELNRTGGNEFSITSALLSCDNAVVKALAESGARIEYAKRVRSEFRGLSDASRRDLIYMSVPLSGRKPSTPGIKFGYVLYIHTSAKDISRIRTIINFAAIDIDTNRFMLFGPDFEHGVRMNEKWDIDKSELKLALKNIDGYFTKLDRFITTLDNDIPERSQTKTLNRELIGAMLRTARRTTEVVNIDGFNNEEALKITPRLERCSWAKRRSKFQLWRIAFNNIFDIDFVNSLGIEYKLHDSVSTMTRKYKGDESVSSAYEIPLLELLSRSLLTSLVTHENFEDLMIPVKFNIANYI